MTRIARLAALVSATAFVSFTQAHTFEYRVVERIGTTDHVLPSNTIHVRPGTTHRYRIQFRVVPDGPTDALAGFIEWNSGGLTTTGGINFRTGQAPNPGPVGRLAPFLFRTHGSADGSPQTDPFISLSYIDAAAIDRSFQWECGPDGTPLPQPEPTPFGRGEFISAFEVTSIATPRTYTIEFAGSLIAGEAFRTIACNPPDCGDPGTPADDMPSSCVYTPLPYDDSQYFSVILVIHPDCGEWNNDSVVNSQDVFAFFADFFAGNADINNDGTTNSDDYFQYIIGFIRGCR